MDAGGPKRGQKSDINVTPLIDIVLVLLIVFIIMVPGLAKSLPVIVPQVIKTDKPPTPDPNNLPLVLEITPKTDGTYKYALQSSEIDVMGLADQLVPVVQLQQLLQRKIYVKVDEDVAYQAVVIALDQIRRASDRAKTEGLAKLGNDGGDVKVSATLRKRPGQ